MNRPKSIESNSGVFYHYQETKAWMDWAEQQLAESEKRYMDALALVPAASDGYSDTLQENPVADYIKDLEQQRDGCGLNMASAKAQMNREPDLAKALQWLESWLCLDDDSIARKFATTLWQHFQAKDERIAELEEEKLSVEVNLMARHSKVETDEHESLKAERDALQEKLLNALDVLRVNGLGAYVDRIRGEQTDE